MITIPKKVEYSVVLLSYLAKNPEITVSLSEAAEKLALPYRFLGQLAMALKKGGIIDSKEGKSGGYSLATGWKEKSLYDVMEALGENKHLVECWSNESGCARLGKCQFTKVWKKVEDGMVKEMQSISLLSMQ